MMIKNNLEMSNFYVFMIVGSQKHYCHNTKLKQDDVQPIKVL